MKQIQISLPLGLFLPLFFLWNVEMGYSQCTDVCKGDLITSNATPQAMLSNWYFLTDVSGNILDINLTGNFLTNHLVVGGIYRLYLFSFDPGDAPFVSDKIMFNDTICNCAISLLIGLNMEDILPENILSDFECFKIISPAPPVITGPSAACLGTQICLTANVTGDATHYQWFPNGAIAMNSDTSIYCINSVNNHHQGSYVVEVVIDGCEVISSPHPLIVSNSFAVGVTAVPTKINPGGTAVVTATVVCGTPPYSYNWSNGISTFTPVPTDAITVSPASTTLYTVSVTDADGNFSTASTTVTVSNLQAQINTLDLTVCEEDLTSLHATGLLGTPPYTYVWNTGAVTPSITVNAVFGASYSVTVTDANNCMATDTTSVCVIRNGFTSRPTNQLIFRLKPGGDINRALACLDATPIDSCDCDNLYLVELNGIDTNDPCFLFDVEEKKQGACMDIEERSAHINYEFDYCNTPAECKVIPVGDPILQSIVVGEIDTGIDSLFANQWHTPVLECGASTDGIMEGTDVIGFDFTETENPWSDSRGHGTHIANIIQNNPSDMLDIFNTKAISGSQSHSNLFGVICGLNAYFNYNKTDALPDSEKIKVVNISAGMYGTEPYELGRAIDSLETQGVIVTCAAGNGYSNLDDFKVLMCQDTLCIADTIEFPLDEVILINTTLDDCGFELGVIIINLPSPDDTIQIIHLLDDGSENGTVRATIEICIDTIKTIRLDHYPSEFPNPNIVSVTAWDYVDNELPEWANTSDTLVDIAAPGVGVLSNIPMELDTVSGQIDSLEAKDGTSQATAFVTREIARLWAENPDSNYTAILSDLYEHCLEQEDSLSGVIRTGGRLPEDVIEYCENDD